VKRRVVEIDVSDHAVLRWLERQHGLDIAAVKDLIRGKTRSAAELGAIALVSDRVRFILVEARDQRPGGNRIVVPTVLRADQERFAWQHFAKRDGAGDD